MSQSNERGFAMILALFMVLVLSTLGSSLMFVSQTDTWSSTNYRLTSQARYAAESGVHKAAHHLLYTYAPPGTALDPLANYDVNVSPVTYNGNPVVLSSAPGVASNYPIAAVRNAFSAAAQGALDVRTGTAAYTAHATLLSMRPFVDPFTGTSTTIQTWRINAEGTIGGPRSARVEVAAVVERPLMPAFRHAAFGTDNRCTTLEFRDDATTDSYDSGAALQSGLPVLSMIDGDVGTNGNLRHRDNSTVNGTLSTPGSGVGSCSTSNVTAHTVSGSATVTGGLVQLAQSATYATPPAPNPLPPTTNHDFDDCLTPPLPNCTSSGGAITITPASPTSQVTFGNIQLDGGSQTVHLNAGIYVVNSLSMRQDAKIVIDSGPVVFQLAGQGSGNVLHVRNDAVIDTGFDPAKLLFVLGGTDPIVIEDDAKVSATVYAPNADATLRDNEQFYGALVAKTLMVRHDAAIHYDRKLRTSPTLVTAGNHTLSSFTWKSY